ncbi:MAG: LLM class flavin-dependent oxidoreductase [Gammaproteobacteria bacterium]|nr:LLM class flavin-dependent oxidoreductase [Gammaproteobacteria bacterium]
MHVDVALEPVYSASELAELAQLADEQGIATLWVTNDPQARDLFMLYMKAAEVTRRVRLGVMAISPFEIHPVKLSSALQTLNEASNGRASLIVGGAGAITANTKLDLSRRVRAVRECIDILQETNADTPLNYEGEIYPVWNFRNEWAVEPRPRVLAGANVDQMLRMSTRHADGIHMSDMPLPLVPGVIEKVAGALETHGRSLDGFEINNFWAFHVKPDGREADFEARSRLILRGMLKEMYIEPFLNEDEVDIVRRNLPSFYKPFYDRDAFRAAGGEFENIPESIAETLVESLTLTAATDDLDGRLEILHDFAAAGLTHITLGLHDDADEAIRLIGKRVVPALTAV